MLSAFSRPLRPFRVGAALLVALVVTFGGSVANAADDPIAGALQRVGDGTYTKDDLDLIRSQPELAGQVPDPETPAEVGVDSSDLGDATTHAICGAWADVWYRKRSLLGSTIFVWHHKVVYCRDGYRVTSWQNRYDYLTEAQSVVYMRELPVNQASGTGGTSAWSHKQRHIEYCAFKWGCYASVYPWSVITVRGNGTVSYTGSAG